MTSNGTAGSLRGVSVLLILVMMVWGLNIPVVKSLSGVMEAVWVGTVRLVAAVVVLSLCVRLRDRRWPALTGRQWRLLALTAFLMVYANQLCFTHGMQLATSTSASLVMALLPTLSIVAGAIAFRDRLPLRAVAGIAIGFAGVALVILDAPDADLRFTGLGEGIIFLGLLSFVSGGLLIQRMVRDLDVLVVGWASYLLGACMLLAHALLVGGWEKTAVAFDAAWVWGWVVYSGMLGTALSNVAWYWAIGRIGQGRASVFLYWLPIFGVGFSALLLGESLGWRHGVALAMVVAGTRLGLARRAAT
ncbi:MAG: DMT family transporter [Lautropia sp.]